MSRFQSGETAQILLTRTANKQIQLNNLNVDGYLEDFINKLLSEYSSDNNAIQFKNFERMNAKYDWIASSFRHAFREDLWKFPELSQPKFLRQPGCFGASCKGITLNKGEIDQGSIYIMYDDHITKYYAAINKSVLLLYHLNKSLRLYDVIFLQGCVIVEETRFNLLTINLIVATQYDSRIILAFKNERKKQYWLKVIRKAGNFRSFKDYYQLKESIASGKHSKIHFAEAKTTHAKFVVKILPKRKFDIFERELLYNEVLILRYLEYPGILKLIDFFNSKSKLYIVLEYIQGVELLKKAGEDKLDEEELRNVVFQLLKILRYIHSVGVVHRDIKLENIMLTSKHEVVLIDFGLSAFSFPSDIMKNPCGTFLYSAPEIVLKQGYNYSVDMWSLGVLIFILITGKPPFYDHERSNMLEQIIELEPDYKDNTWDSYSSDALDFIKSLLNKNPNRRPSAQDALSHQWILNMN